MSIFHKMILRPHFLTTIEKALKRSRIVALLGPRQVGKTTLAREINATSALLAWKPHRKRFEGFGKCSLTIMEASGTLLSLAVR